MQKLWSLGSGQFLHHIDHAIHVMSIDWPCVSESQLFKNRVGLDEILGLLLQLTCQRKQGWCIFQKFFAQLFGFGIKPPRHQLTQVLIERTHRRADRHVVVVQNDQQITIGCACIVHGFIGHACSECAIANDGHSFALTSRLFGRHCHSQRSRNAGGRMGSAKSVVLAFFASWKATQAALLTQRTHLIHAAG